jgi:hypothetical protein
MVASWVRHPAGKEATYPQHLKKFVQEVCPAEVRQTPMIKGDSEVPRRTAHSDPYLTKGEVRVRLPKPYRQPHQHALLATLQQRECAGSKYDSLVAKFYFLPEGEGTFDEKLQSLLSSYGFLVAEYERVIREGLLVPAIDASRARFDVDGTLTEVKIIDTLIWRFAAMLNNGGLKSGIIRYC